jgi:serine/threonine protein kinase
MCRLNKQVTPGVYVFTNTLLQVSVLRVALDVARGMAHLHANKVCHGDLSSNNVLLCTNPDVPAPLGVVAKVRADCWDEPPACLTTSWGITSWIQSQLQSCELQ